MTFLHILGIILKVLGFTLLGAVGLFLVLLLILLLIPIGADVEYIGGNAKVSAKKKSRVRRRKRNQSRKKRAKRKSRRKRKSWISRWTRSLRSSAKFSAA